MAALGPVAAGAAPLSPAVPATVPLEVWDSTVENAPDNVAKGAAQTHQTNWQLTPRGAILPLQDDLPRRQSYWLHLATPLPKGSWTLEFLVAGRDDFDLVVTPPGPLQLPRGHMGAPSRPLPRLSVDRKDGELPVRQMRFVYDAESGVLTGRSNGTLIGNLGQGRVEAGHYLNLNFTSYGN